jgi:proteasome accessory factor A
MTTNRPFLMGAETEFGVAGERHGEYVDPDDLYDLLAEAVKGERAWTEDHHGYRGVYLENGSRLYLDYGSHPEHATAECLTPRQVTLCDKAGEHLMRLAAEGAMRAHPGLTLRVLKNNLDPVEPDDCTYGTHESYTCWVTAAEAAPALIPHLVSRVLYCGAGGLSRHPGGFGFELSQRARHLVRVQGDDTTSNRAIFSTRTRKEIDARAGWMRVHLIGKDSQRAPLGIYLTYGVTGLLIEMLNRGLRVGRGLELAAPVAALRAFSLDPWGKATVGLADGRHLTAAQIQALYLEECERAVQSGGMPEWAPEVLGHWRQTLADMERDPLRLADRLDPYAKLLIYRHELGRSGFDWSDLRDALGRLADLRDRFAFAVVQGVLRDSDAGLEGEQKGEFADAVELAGTRRPRGREAMHLALRMQALDVQYHQLGGLYDRLHAAGRVRDVVVTAGEVEAASRVAPPGGRAALRGAWIRDHREGDWRADWQFVWHVSTRQCLDLRDPFAPRGNVRTIDVPEGEEACYVEVLELLEAPAPA